MSAATTSTTGAQQLWKDAREADKRRDVVALTRNVMLLLVHGHAGSLASIEQQMRRRRFTTRLIAHEYAPECVPPHVIARNPLRAENHVCANYVSFNIEGAKSARAEQAAHGCETDEENVARLRSDCGFLVVEYGDDGDDDRDEERDCGESKTRECWRDALRRYGGHVQATDERVKTLAMWPTCAECNRFPTHVVELRSLDCCRPNVVCSAACWQTHIENAHNQAEWLSDDDDDDDEHNA